MSSSLFPELDKEIKELKIKEGELKEKLKENTQRFEPSNGNEADVVYSSLCSECSKDDVENDKYCDILAIFSSGEYHDDIRETKDTVFCIKSSNFDIKDFKEILK